MGARRRHREPQPFSLSRGGTKYRTPQMPSKRATSGMRGVRIHVSSAVVLAFEALLRPTDWPYQRSRMLVRSVLAQTRGFVRAFPYKRRRVFASDKEPYGGGILEDDVQTGWIIEERGSSSGNFGVTLDIVQLLDAFRAETIGSGVRSRIGGGCGSGRSGVGGGATAGGGVRLSQGGEGGTGRRCTPSTSGVGGGCGGGGSDWRYGGVLTGG